LFSKKARPTVCSLAKSKDLSARVRPLYQPCVIISNIYTKRQRSFGLILSDVGVPGSDISNWLTFVKVSRFKENVVSFDTSLWDPSTVEMASTLRPNFIINVSNASIRSHIAKMFAVLVDVRGTYLRIFVDAIAVDSNGIFCSIHIYYTQVKYFCNVCVCGV